MTDKEKAVLYMNEHKIGHVLQQTLNNLYHTQPTSVYGYLSDELEKFSEMPTISLISGYNIRSLHEDKNRVKVQVSVTTRNHVQLGESVVVGHDGQGDMSLDDLKVLNDGLLGVELYKQETIDNKLKEMEISDDMKLTVSTCLYKTAVSLQQKSLLSSLQHLFDKREVRSPLPVVTVLTSGKLCPGKNNIANLCICPPLNKSYDEGMELMRMLYNKVDEVLKKKSPNLSIVAPNGGFYYVCDRVEQMCELVKEASAELELEAGEHYHFVIDCQSASFHTEVVPGQGSAKKNQTQSTSRHRYDWVEGQVKPTEDMCEMLENLLESESIVALLDPLHHEDKDGYYRLAKALSEKCHIMSRRAVECQGVSVVGRMASSVSVSVGAIKSAEGPVSVVEAAPCEEGDTLLADVVAASNVDLAMLGGLRGVRVNLYNHLHTLFQQTPGSVTPVRTDWGFVKIHTPEPVEGEEGEQTAQ